ncbi:ribbon-helix-helix domain-containing protein [Halosolutus halophilus]|uniref:ribbon-helix-helix domain-containing protein n=1 Tax=Halosolutus halophilus TaxID=1552990 RepID=UPI0022350B5E|nr:ribbon-helix-helix domain-containing protein [Halosolutus halophilus]
MAKQLSVRIGDDLEEAMELEKEKHEFPPNDSEIVRAALRQYLEGNSNSSVRATATMTAD